MYRRRPALLALAVALGVACGAPACHDTGEEARQAYLAAGHEVLAAQAAQKTSATEALHHAEAARAGLARVRAEFPDTDLARKAARPTTFLGPIRIATLEKVWLPELRRRADAESGALACAVFLASGVPEPLARARALADVARAARLAGDTERASELLVATRAAAMTLPASSPGRRAALGTLATAYTAAGAFDLARGVALEGGLADEWHDMAAAMAEAGQGERAQKLVTEAVAGSPPARARALMAIAIALADAGQPDTAATPLAEAEGWAKKSDPLARRRLGVALAHAHFLLQATGPALSWLATSGGLADATLPELEGLVEAVTRRQSGALLLDMVHRDLAVLRGGTRMAAGAEARWLANVGFLQAKLGERDAGLFALARARVLLDPTDEPGPDGRREALALLAAADGQNQLGERLLALGQKPEALGRFSRVLALLGRPALAAGTPVTRRDLLRATAAAGLAKGGEARRAAAAIAGLGDRAALASALASLVPAAEPAASDPGPGSTSEPSYDASPAFTPTPSGSASPTPSPEGVDVNSPLPAELWPLLVRRFAQPLRIEPGG